MRNGAEYLSRPVSPEKPQIKPFDDVELDKHPSPHIPVLKRLPLCHRKSLKSSKSTSRRSVRQSVIVIDSEILIQQEAAESLKFEEIHNQMLVDKKIRLDEKIGRKKTQKFNLRNTKAAAAIPVAEKLTNRSVSLVSGSAQVQKPFDTLRALFNRQRHKIRKELEESREWSETSGPVVMGKTGVSYRTDPHSCSQFDWAKETPEPTNRSKIAIKETSCSAISIQNLGEKPDLSTSRHHLASKGSLDEGSATTYRITTNHGFKTQFSDWTRSHLRNRSAVSKDSTHLKETPPKDRRHRKRNKELLESLIIRRVD